MKSQALQEMIKKVFSDEKTKLQFMSNPGSVLAQFNLTDQEKKAVLNTHAKLGLVTSDSQQLEAALDPTIFWDAPIP
jgi:thiamine biosynthesis lipoprotein ApbE